jgi:hypothetical protein
MKNLATIIALFLCFSAFSQDTLKRTEWIEGKKTLVLEITTSSDFWLIVAKAIPIVLAAIATALFIFYKPKSKEDER